MKKYKIKNTSQSLWFISLFLIFFACLSIFIFLRKNYFIFENSPILMVAFSFYLMFLTIFLTNRIASTDVEIIIDTNGIKKKWVRKVFRRKKLEKVILWENIVKYSFMPDKKFDKLKIFLKDGSKVKFTHDYANNNKDDFLEFCKDFEINIREINSTNNNQIVKGKSIYETNWGILLSVISILIILSVPILLIISARHLSLNHFALLIPFFNAIFFLRLVYHIRMRKKKKRIHAKTANNGIKPTA